VAPHAQELFDAFSDLRVDILDPPGLIEDGDHVAVGLKVSGIHDSAPFAGQPSSGAHLEWESIRIMRFEGEKIAQTRAMQDRPGLMEQLGAIDNRTGEVHWAAGNSE
jgi:predicted ester cyclase